MVKALADFLVNIFLQLLASILLFVVSATTPTIVISEILSCLLPTTPYTSPPPVTTQFVSSVPQLLFKIYVGDLTKRGIILITTATFKILASDK